MAEKLTQMMHSLRAAAEPTRLRLLAICSEGDLTVSEITHIVDQSQPRISRHLKLLCKAGLLVRIRKGHFVLNRVPDNGDGAALVRLVLGQVPKDDEQLQHDRRRMNTIKAARPRQSEPANTTVAASASIKRTNPNEQVLPLSSPM